MVPFTSSLSTNRHSVSVSVFLPLSPLNSTFFLCLSLSPLSLSFCQFVCLSSCLSLAVSVSFCLSLFLSLSPSLAACHRLLCLSGCLSLYQSDSVSLFQQPLSLSLSLLDRSSLSVSSRVSVFRQSLCVYFSFNSVLSVCLSLFLSVTDSSNSLCHPPPSTPPHPPPHTPPSPSS